MLGFVPAVPALALALKQQETKPAVSSPAPLLPRDLPRQSGMAILAKQRQGRLALTYDRTGPLIDKVSKEVRARALDPHFQYSLITKSYDIPPLL